MAISASDIVGLKNRPIYDTSNEKIVLTKDFEKIIHSPEFKILGFLNGYMYTSSGVYLEKSTLDGNTISDINLEVDHAAFHEGLKFFYAYIDNILYKVTDNLVVEWSKQFEDVIQSLEVDIKGSVYIVFESIRDIMKFLPDGTDIVHISGSDDPSKTVRLYDCFISDGAGWVYSIGTEFWDYDSKVQSFIDKYNAKTWEKTERLIFGYNTGISVDDPQYAYDKFNIIGDYIYIYGLEYLCKMNIKGIEMWKYAMGYNPATNTFDELAHIEYDDNPMTEFLYFEEDLFSSNGHSFGKIGLNGKTIWKLTLTDSVENTDFRFSIYRDKLYTTNKTYIETKHGYVLSLDNDRVLFRTRDGHLVKIVEYNDRELYSPDNFYGEYLLADFIKEGIPKIVYHPLRHDNGDMVDEFRNVLLLPEENEHYTDLENYEYKYLLASNYKIEANEMSIIFAKNYKPVLTKLANVIKTKEPYLPDRTHEFILNKKGNRIDTMQDYDLIRSRFMYSYDRYLLADRNMFFTEIITKDLGFTIITKRYGHEIIRKVREIYSYMFCKYDEMSLIEEWLKENGILDTTLPDYVEELRHHTLDMIRDVQVAGTPVQYNINPYKEFEYTFDGYEYPNNTWGTQIFSCTNLPFDKRRCNKKIYIDSIANLVARQEMRPILLFLNGKAIKWSDCTIVRDWAYTYVVIKNTNPYENDLSCIMFPCDIRYGEDNNCLPADVCDTHFYFDASGKLTTNRSQVKIRMEVIDENVVGEILNYSKKYIEVQNEYNQRANERNIFVFEDNLLFPESRFYLQDNGKDIFTYLRDTTNAVFKTFYWIKANSYKGLLYKIPNGQYTKDTVIEGTKGKSTTQIDDFRPPFNFHMSRNRLYDENVAKAVEYIMGYDMSLLVKYYKQMSYIESYVFDGEYLINRVPKDGGWLIMPRSRRRSYDDYIIVFRNNHLYEWYKGIEYDTHNFKIPIFDHIKRTDKIEILHFKEVDNYCYSLTVDKVKADYIPEGLRYDNFLLFGNAPSGSEVYPKYSVETSNYYDVDFSYKNNFDNGKYRNTEIKLNDPYYENKSINICSKRQFRYMYYNIFKVKEAEEKGGYYINLSPDFKFCHEKSKYLIFLNWKLLSQDDFDLHVMTTESPHKYIWITFNVPLKDGDVADIFYLPMSYNEIDISDTVDMNYYGQCRDIIMDINTLGYQFDKDLFLLAIDGFKVNYAAIENISNHRCRVTEDPTISDPIVGDKGGYGLMALTKPVFKIYQFIQPDQLLGKLVSYSDTWSDAIDKLSPELYLKMLVEKTKA